MNQSLVSIIIPAYNSEKHIKNSIESVLNQTYQNIELIIINDGSTDKTKENILRMKEIDNRIKYYEIINSGVSTARNIGIQNATGKYVGFVDADDYIEEDMVNLLVTKAEKHSCDLVSCTFKRVYPDKVIPEKAKIPSGYYNKGDLVDTIYPNLFGNKYLKTILPLNIVTKLFNREIIEKHALRFETDLKFGEDLLFTQEFLLNAESFYFVSNKPSYNYTFNESSVTSTHYENKWDNLKMGINKRKRIAERFPEYDLYDQIPYATIISARNALANASKNKNATKQKRLNELSHIILDKDVQSALGVSEFGKLHYKDKIKIELMKRKQIKIYYLIQNI